jgi:microcystin-dependent protein
MKAQKDREINVSELINLVYPVGSIYMSVINTSPANLFGGTWIQIEDTFLLSAGKSYTAGNTGGSATVTLSASEIPSHTHTVKSVSETGAHTHTRGTMNITGSVQTKDDLGYVGQFTDAQGAFHVDGGPGRGRLRCTEANVADRYLRFDASRNWIGETSPNGSHTHTVTLNNTGSGQSHNNMPPYLVVYTWKRTE